VNIALYLEDSIFDRSIEAVEAFLNCSLEVVISVPVFGICCRVSHFDVVLGHVVDLFPLPKNIRSASKLRVYEFQLIENESRFRKRGEINVGWEAWLSIGLSFILT